VSIPKKIVDAMKLKKGESLEFTQTEIKSILIERKIPKVTELETIHATAEHHSLDLNIL